MGRLTSLEGVPDHAVPGVTIGSCQHGAGLFAARYFAPSEVVLTFDDAVEAPLRTFATLEVAAGSHVRSTAIVLLNHSCEPNLWVDVERQAVVAVRPIAPGEMLTFFYPGTEWEMARPFACRCGAASCLGWIEGARHLPDAVLRRHRLSPYIVALMSTRTGTP